MARASGRLTSVLRRFNASRLAAVPVSKVAASAIFKVESWLLPHVGSLCYRPALSTNLHMRVSLEDQQHSHRPAQHTASITPSQDAPHAFLREIAETDADPLRELPACSPPPCQSATYVHLPAQPRCVPPHGVNASKRGPAVCCCEY
jgi:hypothetical protein